MGDPQETFSRVREILTASMITVLEDDESALDVLGISPVERSLGLITANFITFTAVDAEVDPMKALLEFFAGFDFDAVEELMVTDDDE